MKLNLNVDCLITEWPRGRAAFDRHFFDLGLDPEYYRALWRSPDGRLKLPLWEVARIYGPEMVMGPQPPIAPEMEIAAGTSHDALLSACQLALEALGPDSDMGVCRALREAIATTEENKR